MNGYEWQLDNLSTLRYDLLRYVGHESTLDEVKEMLDQVDYNHNGTMDRRGSSEPLKRS